VLLPLLTLAVRQMFEAMPKLRAVKLHTPSARLNVPKVRVYHGSSQAQSLTIHVPILLLFFMLRVMVVTTATTTSGIVVMTASSKEMPFFTASP
jgi:hypothetical protein